MNEFESVLNGYRSAAASSITLFAEEHSKSDIFSSISRENTLARIKFNFFNFAPPAPNAHLNR